MNPNSSAQGSLTQTGEGKFICRRLCEPGCEGRDAPQPQTEATRPQYTKQEG